MSKDDPKSSKTVPVANPPASEGAKTAAAAKPRRTKSAKPTTPSLSQALQATTTTPPVLPSAEEPEKVKKTRKQKLVRDSFKFPPQEYAAIDTLKTRCLQAGHAVKKGELVRAGLAALLELDDKQLIQILGRLEKLVSGRPAS